jgi:hypothetical protein
VMAETVAPFAEYTGEREEYAKKRYGTTILVPTTIGKFWTTETCNQCGESVAFGSGRFVNRLPSSFDKGEAPFDTEYMCAECYEKGTAATETLEEVFPEHNRTENV